MVKVLRYFMTSLAALVVLASAVPVLAQSAQDTAQPAAPSAAAAADQPAPGQENQGAGTEAAPGAPAAAATTPAAAADPAALRASCEAALKSDAEWRSELKDQLRSEVHEEDYNAMVLNRRHVVYAYAALWIITVLFVVFMWLRQKSLLAEIGRLEHEIRQAGAGGGKAG